MPTREELKTLQALPLDLKVAKTKLRIKEFIEHFGKDEVYISFSGGKDSTVLMHLVRSIYPNIKGVFADTGLEYPEIRTFVKSFDNIEVVRPLMNFRRVIETHGYPIVSKSIALKIHRVRKKKSDGESACLKYFNGEGINDHDGSKSVFNCEKYKPLLNAPFYVSHMCCDEMKKKPMHNIGIPIIGVLASESKDRTTKWVKNSCNVFNELKSSSQPLSFWTEQDILHYINLYGLKVCSVYGKLHSYSDIDKKLRFDGEQRTGCVFCGFGAHLEKGESRFQRLKRTHPKLYNYCINGGEFNDEGMWQPNKEGLGMGFVFDWCNERIDNFEIKY